ncbi:MAG: hypothetical protein ABS87_14850 [Sphingomonas sp. SCN 67-18]|nr:MAG: hypothetical protein ABS87_14850 [Sphingomonas sp. SCN 67-18]
MAVIEFCKGAVDVVGIDHPISDRHVANADSLSEGIGNCVGNLRRCVEQVEDGLAEIPIERVDQSDLSVSSLDCGEGASFVEAVGSVKRGGCLLPVAADERIHAMKETNFILVLDVMVGRKEAFGLEQANLLRDQLVASIDEDEDRDIRRFPTSALRKIPIPMGSP